MSLNLDLSKIKGKKSLIWTRSEENWEEDKALVEAYPYVHLPCLSFEKIDVTRNDRFDAIVFTSPRAVMFALSTLELRNIRIFCFGKKTQSVVENHGYFAELLPNIRSAKEIPDLLENILAPHSSILLPGPQERAFDLEIPLREKKFHVKSIDLYKTVSQLNLSDEEKTFCIEHLNGTVFFASPSACKSFVESLDPQENRLGNELQAVAIGPTSADYCKKYFKNVRTASENSIKKALEEWNQTS